MRKPPRTCLPSKEREDYALFQRKKGCSLVTERQKNRYIDEFLRYCSSQLKHSDALKILESNLIDYGQHVGRTTRNLKTAHIKVSIVLQWFHWLAMTNRIPNDPAKGLKAAKIVSGVGSPNKNTRVVKFS